MSEADDKAMARRDWKYLDKGYPVANNQITEKRDVEFQGGYTCEFSRLSQRKEVTDFLKEIEAQADDSLGARSDRNGGSRLCSFVSEDFVACAIEEETASINRKSLAPEADGIVSGIGARLYASVLLEFLLPCAIK